MNRTPYLGTITIICLILLLWTGSVLGVFKLPNLMLYDLFVHTTPERKLASQKVLLIEASPDKSPPESNKWSVLNQRLQSLGAKQIVYTFLPENASRKFFEHAGSMQNICFGRDWDVKKPVNTELQPEPVPEQARGLDLQMGINSIPKPDYGIYRYHQKYVRTNGEKFPTLVYAAARQFLDKPVSSKQRFLVNFNGISRDLGKISLQRALSRQMIPELVQGKSVLIGFAEDKSISGMPTPINPGSHGVSTLEFQGMALDTLISEKSIYNTGPWINLACLFVVSLIGVIVYQLLGTSLGLWITGVTLAVYITICWLLFSLLFIWTPVFEIVVAQCLVFGVISKRRQIVEMDTIQTVLNRLSNRIKSYIIPEDFISTKRHWHNIVNLLAQTLNLDRSIFLEPVENDHRVREIVAYHCSLQDIAERRRDFERTPYTTALSENGPIRVDNFLTAGEKAEIQFLVPLSFAGQVMGFWAFGIHPDEYEAFDNFQNTVTDYSLQIAEMLYQRQKWLEQESKLNNPLRRLLFLSAGKTISQEVFETYTFIDRKLLLFDSLLSGLNTAVVVYDLFGHVVQINSRMEKLLQEMDYKPFELTAAEMGSYLTHTDTARIRQQLNKVVTLQESVNMPVITPSHIQKDFMLQITPLQMETEGDSAFEAVQPFRTQGILFELVEITEFKEICTLKDDLLEDFHDRQRRAIEDMASYLSRMDMADIDWEEIKRSVPELQQALNSFVAAKDTINNYISKNLYSETVLEYPIVFNKYLEQAMQSLNLLASNKQLQFSTHSPENPVLVFAVPSLLFKLFYSVLELLIEDATQKSTISVYIEQYNGFMHFNFYNQGFGMPDETFQHYLFSPQAKVSQAFLHIRELLTYVQKWDGDLTGTSTVGEGISFTLKLKTLH